MAGKSIRDLMHDEHATAGRTKGSVSDKERQRLIAKTGKPGTLSLSDLYAAAGERNRVTGRYTPR